MINFIRFQPETRPEPCHTFDWYAQPTRFKSRSLKRVITQITKRYNRIDRTFVIDTD